MNKHNFSKTTAWIFDLDNTLYPPAYNLSALIDVRMTEFIARALNLDREAAFALQKKYWHKYGLTLIGLMQEHGLAPEAYLDFVHDIDISHIQPNPALHAALGRLQGAKYIFTDSAQGYAEKIIDRLGIGSDFDDIFDIRKANYTPKPKQQAYESMLAHFRLNPQQAAFFEDIVGNLAPAHALGMTTIWLCWPQPNDHEQTRAYYQRAASCRQTAMAQGYVDYIIEDLVAFLDGLTDNSVIENMRYKGNAS